MRQTRGRCPTVRRSVERNSLDYDRGARCIWTLAVRQYYGCFGGYRYSDGKERNAVKARRFTAWLSGYRGARPGKQFSEPAGGTARLKITRP